MLDLGRERGGARNNTNMEHEFDSNLRIQSHPPQMDNNGRDGGSAPKGNTFQFRAPQEHFTAQDFELGKIYGVGSYSKASMKNAHIVLLSVSLPRRRGRDRKQEGCSILQTCCCCQRGSIRERKVWIRWPDDNNFYEAVITDYDPSKGLHALVYDINTENEAWEWVNLKEMSPEEIRWEGENAGVSQRGGTGGPGRGIKKLGPRSAGPGPGPRSVWAWKVLVNCGFLIVEFRKRKLVIGNSSQLKES